MCSVLYNEIRMSLVNMCTLMFILISHSNAWLLPPSSLISQFAVINNRFSIIFHLPNHDNDNLIHLYRMKFRSFSKQFPLTFIHQTLNTTSNFIRTDEDLHIIILNDLDQTSIIGQNLTFGVNATIGQNQTARQNVSSKTNITAKLYKSIYYIKDMIGNRQRSDKEFYLVDIGNRNRTQTEQDFYDLEVDLDDEVYFYSYKNQSGTNITGMAESLNKELQIYEVYTIMDGMPIIILEFANWTEQTRLQLSDVEKCKRRRDLKVSKSEANI